MKGIWIETYTGKKFYPSDVKLEDIDIEDIAHSLSLICRFNGHCEKFYSVAEHSVRVSDLLPKKYKLAGLLHDAVEAYISDLPKPIKLMLGNVEEIEYSILEKIFDKFHVPFNIHYLDTVKWADNVLLATEARDLMRGNLKGYPLRERPLKEVIDPWESDMIEQEFLCAFEEIKDIVEEG